MYVCIMCARINVEADAIHYHVIMTPKLSDTENSKIH